MSGQSGQGEQSGVDPGEDGALSLVQMVEILSSDWRIVDSRYLTMLCCMASVSQSDRQHSIVSLLSALV